MYAYEGGGAVTTGTLEGFAARRARMRRERARSHSGRKALAGAFAALVLALCLGQVAKGSGQDTVRITVQPGQTLWSIAASRYPGADPRDVIDRIEGMNRLDGPAISPGETLVVPRS